ncbi:hypothetical protein FRX31_020927 [Thalictrum thalictroides]|uniref:Uncharacterized protein n=1 Tax=Thalictrum thalictroides TaxID=46969 RepID=A0A7J6VWI9_THATH|nr:hypothetical protein FRX31_020927 [Thalictrum thalictroides]
MDIGVMFPVLNAQNGFKTSGNIGDSRFEGIRTRMAKYHDTCGCLFLSVFRSFKKHTNLTLSDKFQVEKWCGLLSALFQHWNTEVVCYRRLTSHLQADRTLVLRREKDLGVNAESSDAART